MGKSTTADLFRQAGARVYDADAEVSALYGRGGAAVAPVAEAFPGVVQDGAVDRERLSAALAKDPVALARLEAVVHPLVQARRQAFLEQARAATAAVVVLDIPLLFEVGAQHEVDAVVVATAPEQVQRARVMARTGMTDEKLALILARQIPDAEKRARADFVIDTSQGVAHAGAQVQKVLDTVSAPGWTAPRRKA